ncbi:PaaX family transcriptional regulator [Pseudonocardia sp. RS11V-5]|uniref:PaaX family transcriptional regulator n=1 Tax=Pseudonocardia terrae TaxID=2905831 RepID=UPI001E28F1B8|nr:PaaX family transcriptional regulator C-terminal domain-containing protein [Pseudonocardia terrae]MCE3551189.1 PaaX family transcriptional regulator [Pseudonocardia terrae]
MTSPLPAPSARSLLLTVAGEMLYDEPAGAWTTALLRVFASLGVEDHACRQLLARSTNAGWLTRVREGRAVRWTLDARGRELVEEGMRRSDAYLSDDRTWDEHWLVLYVNVPQNRRTTRKRLYGGLDWLGFGNPVAGVWVTPHSERAPALTRLIAALELEQTSFAVSGRRVDLGLTESELVARAWDLTELEVAYQRFLQMDTERPDPRTPDEVLTAYLELLNLQQRFMRRDPQLPVALQPEWVGREAAARFRARRGRWAEAAHRRFREIVAESSPRTPDRV